MRNLDAAIKQIDSQIDDVLKRLHAAEKRKIPARELLSLSKQLNVLQQERARLADCNGDIGDVPPELTW